MYSSGSARIQTYEDDDLVGSVISEQPTPLGKSNQEDKGGLSRRLSNRSNDFGMIASLLLAGSSDLGYKTNKHSGQEPSGFYAELYESVDQGEEY